MHNCWDEGDKLRRDHRGTSYLDWEPSDMRCNMREAQEVIVSIDEAKNKAKAQFQGQTYYMTQTYITGSFVTFLRKELNKRGLNQIASSICVPRHWAVPGELSKRGEYVHPELAALINNYKDGSLVVEGDTEATLAMGEMRNCIQLCNRMTKEMNDINAKGEMLMEQLEEVFKGEMNG